MTCGGRRQVKGDGRLLRTHEHGSTYSLHFPTVVRVRWDKAAADCDATLTIMRMATRSADAGAGPDLPILRSQLTKTNGGQV